MLSSVPVASGEIRPVTMMVAMPLAGRLTVVATLAVPLATPQLPGGIAAQVQVTPVTAGGGWSVTGAPVTGLGPAFSTVMV